MSNQKTGPRSLLKHVTDDERRVLTMALEDFGVLARNACDPKNGYDAESVEIYRKEVDVVNCLLKRLK